MKFHKNLRVSHATLIAGWQNCLIDKRNSCDIACGVWEFGKTIGVSSIDPEREIVKRLEVLENRDRVAAGKEPGGVGGS